MDLRNSRSKGLLFFFAQMSKENASINIKNYLTKRFLQCAPVLGFDSGDSLWYYACNQAEIDEREE